MKASLNGALSLYKKKYPARFKRLAAGIKEGIKLSEQELKASVTEDYVNKINQEWDSIQEDYGTGGYFVSVERLLSFLNFKKNKPGSKFYDMMIKQTATPEDIEKYKRFRATNETILDGENVTEVLSELYLKIVKESRQEAVMEQRFDNNMRSWVQNLFSKDEEFKKIFVREAATGEATFKNNPNAVATHYLSPNSHKDFNSKEGEKYIAAMANAVDFSYVPGDRSGALRKKARTNKQSEMSFRLGLSEASIKEQLELLNKLQSVADRMWDARMASHADRVYPDLTTFDASSGSFEGNRDDDLDESEDAGKSEEQKVIDAIGKEVADEVGAGFSAVEQAYKKIVNETEPLPVTDEDAMTVLDNIEDYINDVDFKS